jgi:hypothetical protein
LVGATHGGGIVTHPLTLVIPPQEILRICALIVRRTSDGRIELACSINGNRMISLGSMRRMTRHTGIGIGIKPPALGIILNEITDIPQLMP